MANQNRRNAFRRLADAPPRFTEQDECSQLVHDIEEAEALGMGQAAKQLRDELARMCPDKKVATKVASIDALASLTQNLLRFLDTDPVLEQDSDITKYMQRAYKMGHYDGQQVGYDEGYAAAKTSVSYAATRKAAVDLTEQELAVLNRAFTVLQTKGISLDEAVQQFEESKKEKKASVRRRAVSTKLTDSIDCEDILGGTITQDGGFCADLNKKPGKAQYMEKAAALRRRRLSTGIAKKESDPIECDDILGGDVTEDKGFCQALKSKPKVKKFQIDRAE
jgi:hypothetical protein